MAMPTSTANWHWKNKNITPWTRTWLERELLRVIIGADGAERVAVTNVDSVEGDAELGQRKSKCVHQRGTRG
jgi:activator of HSP90 ATPase